METKDLAAGVQMSPLSKNVLEIVTWFKYSHNIPQDMFLTKTEVDEIVRLVRATVSKIEG